MRYSFFSLPLAVSAAVLETRQLGSAAPVAGIEKLEPQIRKVAGVQRTLTKFGPYELPGATAGTGKPGDSHSHSGGGMSMGGMGGDNTLSGKSMMLSIQKGLCNTDGPCTVYGGRVGIMFADSDKPATPENGVYIHHVLTTDTTKKAANFLTGCNTERPGTSISSLGVGTGFIGLGEDTGNTPVLYTRGDGTSDSGYHVGKGDRFLANVQLVNYNKEAKKVYVTYDLEFAPGETGNNAKGMLVSAEMCGKRIATSTTGPANTTAGTFTFLEDGTIIGARGHLHDGGVQMDMFINNKYVCSSKAKYGGDGSEVGEWKTISAMSRCDEGIKVKKGDKFSMNVQYDLQRYPLRKAASGAAATGVMGMWSLTFETTKK